MHRSSLACAFKQLLIGAALVMLMGVTPAYSQITQTFGRLGPGRIASAGLPTDTKRASRFMSDAGTISKLCAYLDGNGGVSGSQRFRLALYRETNGTPAEKIFDTPEQTIASGTAARWYCIDAPLLRVSGGFYWIAIHTGGTGGVIRDFYDGGVNSYSGADAFDDGSAATFGAGNAADGTLAACAEYYAENAVRAAGQSFVGTVPSGGMTADFKRGSSFTMPERGKLFGITALLDGNGSPALQGQVQQFKYAIYSDSNGVPGAKLYESFAPLSIRGGAPAIWTAHVADSAIAPTLEAGRYWLVILTGATSGVVRNFSNGVAGNWYGNADTFSDGASAQFGAGNPGNGTLSAFISYRPGTVTDGVMGRSDMTPTPSGGLSANVTRWSQFELKDSGATLTGLHAYLDGQGGASGSQTVRMAIYNLQTTHGAAWYVKLAQSEDVTITSITPPQWVHFAVPSVSLPFPGTYVIAIQSGDTAGVARDYGDTRPNPGGDWNSIADSFADGALTTIPAESYPPLPGSVTLSAYATYSVPPP